MMPDARRRAVLRALAAAGLGVLPLRLHAAPTVIANVTGLNCVTVARVEVPRSTAEVAALVRSWPGRIAVGGGRYSMGGQIAIAGGLHLDMRQMNRLIWLRPAQRTVRVQAGMCWRDLQALLDPHDLAVKIMQSFANFTVGGSVAVNVHGRYVQRGAIGNSVRAVQLVLANGEVVELTPQHGDLFRAAIGGYGAVGVITEVELDLADNLRIERRVAEMSLEDYAATFAQQVRNEPRAVLHNADLLPPNFDRPLAITWLRAGTDTPPTEPERLQPRHQAHHMYRAAAWVVSELPGGYALRHHWHRRSHRDPAVKWLNHEASLDVAELEPFSREGSTYVLQEYFVPIPAFLRFARSMAAIIRTAGANVLNVSIRHAPADGVALLPWAKTEVFSFVLYYKQSTTAAAQVEVQRWTRQLIDLALSCGGRYYLPYQLHATPQQFARAYPEVVQLRRIKQQVDPAGKFSNQLWATYLPRMA